MNLQNTSAEIIKDCVLDMPDDAPWYANIQPALFRRWSTPQTTAPHDVHSNTDISTVWKKRWFRKYGFINSAQISHIHATLKNQEYRIYAGDIAVGSLWRVCQTQMVHYAADEAVDYSTPDLAELSQVRMGAKRTWLAAWSDPKSHGCQQELFDIVAAYPSAIACLWAETATDGYLGQLGVQSFYDKMFCDCFYRMLKETFSSYTAVIDWLREEKTEPIAVFRTIVEMLTAGSDDSRLPAGTYA